MVTDNHIGVEGTQALAKVLELNTTLVELVFGTHSSSEPPFPFRLWSF
jgi:hypothetical protein